MAHVGLSKLWVFRNDYLEFELLSEEQRKLMKLMLEYTVANLITTVNQ